MFIHHDLQRNQEIHRVSHHQIEQPSPSFTDHVRTHTQFQVCLIQGTGKDKLLSISCLRPVKTK